MVKAYVCYVHSKFGGSMKSLSDSGNEFRNTLIAQVAQVLSMKQVFSFPYYPRCNSHLEGFHNFVKTHITKHID